MDREYGLKGLAPESERFSRHIEVFSAITKDLPVDVRYIGGSKGKGLFAKHDIPKNEKLFSEFPVVCQLNNDPNWPIRVCDNCLRFVGPFQDQLELLASSVEGSSFNAKNRNSICLPSKKILKNLRKYEPNLPTAVHCEGGDAIYCSNECKMTAWNSHHEILCQRSHRLFSRISLETYFKNRIFRLTMAAKLIAQIMQRVRRDNIPVMEAIDRTIGGFKMIKLTQAFTETQKVLHPETIGKLDHDKEEKIFFDTYFREPIKLLKRSLLEESALLDSQPSTLTSSSSSDYLYFTQDERSQFELLFTDEFFDILLGTLQTNCKEIKVKSPLHAYFDAMITIEPKSSEQFIGFLSKIKSKFGGVPQVEASGLYNLYSTLNHSCNANAVSMKPSIQNNADNESRSNDYTDARSNVFSLCNIKSNTEVTVSYVYQNIPRSERDKELAKWMFKCKCERCLTPECTVCLKYGKDMKCCARCNKVYYCSRDCQVLDWKIHKQNCGPSNADSIKDIANVNSTILITNQPTLDNKEISSVSSTQEIAQNMFPVSDEFERREGIEFIMGEISDQIMDDDNGDLASSGHEFEENIDEFEQSTISEYENERYQEESDPSIEIIKDDDEDSENTSLYAIWNKVE